MKKPLIVLTRQHITQARAEVKRHCMGYCDVIAKSKNLSSSDKKRHYALAYSKRDKQMAIVDKMALQVVG